MTPSRFGTRHNPLPVLPIYHVHGYVPIPSLAAAGHSRPDEIVFTEEQYHRAEQDALDSRLPAATCGESSTAIRRAPLACENYALLQRPRPRVPEPPDLQRIDEKAREYQQRFEASGIKTQ